MIAVVNYGLGNLHSVQKALAHVGGEAVITADPQTILEAEKVVLPGVGAFADGMRGLESRGLVPAVREAARRGTPFLGICLGMQLLFDTSDEQGRHPGLGLLAGKVRRFPAKGVKVPQIGWNQVRPAKASKLLAGLGEGDYFYFNHGYYCEPADPGTPLTITEYGLPYASAVEKGNIFGVQYHPEKSQRTGLQLLKNFVEKVR